MIDDFQRAERRRYLGSSDAAAIVGRDPWRTPADVYLEKTAALGPETRESPALELGRYLESGILDWTAAQLRLPALVRDESFAHPEHEMLAVNLDARTPFPSEATPDAIIEAKTAGLLGMGAHLDEWGDAGTDGVPTHVLIQTHHQFCVVNAQPSLAHVRVCWVPALIARRGFVLFRIDRNDDLVGALLEAELSFWRNHVESHVMPEGDPPSLEILNRLRREPAKTVPIVVDFVTAWREAKTALETAKKREEETKRAVIAALGDAEAGEYPGGVVTYLETNRAGYAVAPTTFRTLRVKEEKRSTSRARKSIRSPATEEGASA